MSTLISQAVLDTVLGRLALLFLSGAGADLAAARHAAADTLSAYHPETEGELNLAAGVISFSLHALEALSQACDPDLPLKVQLSLRSSAIGLSREGHKAQRKLDQLQSARRAGIPQHAAAEATAPDAQTEQAVALVELARKAIGTVSKNKGQTWTQAFQKRELAKRITKNLQKNQALHALRSTQPADQKLASASIATCPDALAAHSAPSAVP